MRSSSSVRMKDMKPYPVITFIISVALMLVFGTNTTKAYPQNAEQVNLPVVFKTFNTAFTNPGFEQETAGWVVHSNQGDSVVTTAAAHTGIYAAGLGNGGSTRVVSIAQQVKVPQQDYAVQYMQWAQSLEPCNDTKNRVMVYVNGSPYQHYKICQDSNNSKWVVKNIYLAPYKGQTVVFKLEFESSTIPNNYLYVDDFSFESP